MNGNRYKFLGFVVWQGGKWYLRKRLPRARTVALSGVAATGGLLATGLLAKRLAG
jgi:hypothetical protein